MHLYEDELFYQEVNRRGLKIHEVDGFDYRYCCISKGLSYTKWVDNFKFERAVSIEDLEFLQGKQKSFVENMNKQFSKAYAERIGKKLINPKLGEPIIITYPQFSKQGD